MTRGNEIDIETGVSTKSNKTEHKIDKCYRFITKVALMFFIVTIYIGYFMAISTDMNIFGNIQDFIATNATNFPIKGISFYGNWLSMNLSKAKSNFNSVTLSVSTNKVSHYIFLTKLK